ncbi:MAG: CHAD domain-containing protein [bacterium]
MNKRETGEFIFRFYRKRTASFLANLYKASITGDAEDIHKARVDVKKILALFRLFEMVSTDYFRSDDHLSLFTDLFNLTGKIREIQVNGLLLIKYGFINPEISLYKNSLKARETRLTKQFLATVQEFEEREIKKTEIVISHFSKTISQKKLIETVYNFTRKKGQKIRKLLISKKTPEHLHKIRQNLKIIGAILLFTKTIKSDSKLNKIIPELLQAEYLIGEWHDRQVFLGSINSFIKSKVKSRNFQVTGLKREIAIIQDDCLILENQIFPQVERLISTILDKPAATVSTMLR